MTLQELEELKTDLRTVRKAVERHSPLFREIAASGAFSFLALPYGILTLVFGIGTQILVWDRGGFDRLPIWWPVSFWLYVFLVLVVGGVVKVAFLRKRAAKAGGGFWSLVLTIWANDWFHVNVSGALTLLGISVFAASSGHPWFILPACTIYYGFMISSMGFLLVARFEYFAAGWFAVLAGTISIFTLERAPWLWLGILAGGMLLIFGVGGLLPQKADKPGGDE